MPHRRDHDRARLPPVRARRHRAAEAGAAAGRPRSGAAIAVEIWAIPSHRFGDFIETVAPPLSVGTLTTADGRQVKGFLVEAEATRDARDISAFGGWRAFKAQAKVSA